MARIAGVDIPNEKRIETALTYVYGIGPTLSKRILSEAGISLDTRVKDLTESDIASIRSKIDSYIRMKLAIRRVWQKTKKL